MIEYVLPTASLGSEEFKKTNPTGKIPALQINDRVLGESEVICEYIEDLFPEPSLRPEDPLGRAQVRLLSRIVDLYILTPLFKMLPHLSRKFREDKFVEDQLVDMNKGLESLEINMSLGGYQDGNYAVGSYLTLADCALVPMLFLQENTVPILGVSKPFAEFPIIETYWQKIQSDEYCAKVLAEMRKGLSARMS